MSLTEHHVFDLGHVTLQDGATLRGRDSRMETSRPDDARIEKELDIRLSALESYVEALGGRLQIHAVFDDDDVKVTA